MPSDTEDLIYRYCVRLADDAAILCQRLGEWCGHAPSLEEDIALTNIALDLIGQARALYCHAAECEGEGRDEDQLAFLRNERQFTNVLLVEQPNGDFARTVVRQFLFSAVMHPYWREMTASTDATLAAIAAKAEKELAYHLRHSAEWMIRLGDGTEESHARLADALDWLWPYRGELLECDALTRTLIDRGVAIDPATIRDEVENTFDEVLRSATMTPPAGGWMQTGGRDGRHSEHLGHILSEMQYLQRSYPGLKW